MNKTRFSALLCAVMLMISILPTSSAKDVKESVIDLEDGFYIIETVKTIPLSRSGDTVKRISTYQLYKSTTLIGVTTIGGVFEVSGSTAKAVEGYITGTGYNGWSYVSGSTRCSGNTVTGTATYRSEDGVTKSHSGSVTYTP